MNRSIRCRHGMCLATVGCETCGVTVPERAGRHLRRSEERRSNSVRAPDGYGTSDGKRRQQGNTNARTRTGERA
jgi:hypothetical protein